MRINVGGGLPPMTVAQLKYLQLMDRHRGHAPSHLFCCVNSLGLWVEPHLLFQLGL